MTFLDIIHQADRNISWDDRNRNLKGDPFVERLRATLPREK